MRKALLFTLKYSCTRVLGIMLFASSIGFRMEAQVDCPPITVFCQDIHTTFMPGVCMVEVWAKDFINKINNPDTDLDDFIISFDEHTEQLSQIFESKDGNSLDVTIWITSRCDTTIKTRCIARIDINDNTGICPTKPCPVDPNPWCGLSVVTCTTVQTTPTEMTGHVAAIIDTRKNSKAPRGDNWANPINPGEDVVPFARPEAWRISNIGNVFGVSLNPTNGDIFLAASDVYDFDFQQFVTIGPPPPSVTGPAGSGGIYRSNILNAEITNVFVGTTNVYPAPASFAGAIIGKKLIPNTGNDPNDNNKSGNGIGNIDYDLVSNHLFASNLEDGKLYSINASTGLITDVFDPFTPYVHSPGLVTASERVWGVQVHDCGPTSRLYFARNTTAPVNLPDVIQPKQVWSVAINHNGTFAGVERIELVVQKGDMPKLTDISFNSDCSQMLVIERGNAHSAELNRYKRNNVGDWVFDRQFYLGLFDLDNQGPDYPAGIAGNSAGGGCAFGPTEENCVVDAACDALVWGTINCGDIIADDSNPLNTVDCAIYGVEGINSTGNELATSSITDIYISVDTTDDPLDILRLKSNLGDIEFFNCCCPSQPGRVDLSGINAMIAGEIYTEQKFRVGNTKVDISSISLKKDMMTNNYGEYLFEDLFMHNNYSIVPKKEASMLDGISTLDMILIQKHILGLTTLKSPYKIIAADIDSNQKITANDMVLLRKLILGQIDGENLESWSFVPAKFEFNDPKDPFPFDQEIRLNDLEENAMHEDFIAIKKGDVNGDNLYNILGLKRSEMSATLIVEQIGNIAHIKLNQDVDATGLQFELTANAPFFTNTLIPGVLSVSEYNTSVSEKSFRFSWSNASPTSINKGDILFSIQVENNSANELFFNFDKIVPEVYDANIQKYNLNLISQEIGSTTTLLGNSPNPFSKETVITFELTEDQNVTFDFFNLEGKKIHHIARDFNKGRNSLVVQVNELGLGNGSIIVYKMLAAGFADTGKLIIME